MADLAGTNEVQQCGDIAPAPPTTSDPADQAEQCKPIEEAQSMGKENVEPEADRTTPCVTSHSSTPELPRPFQLDKVKADEKSNLKRKDEDKLGIYKALAIKLKKELVKTRDELQRLQEDHRTIVGELEAKVKHLETTLESERVSTANANITLEATCKNLKSQLETAEEDLQSLQTEFDNYKTRATKIMQQNNFSLANTHRTMEEDRYKQMKVLNDELRCKVMDLSSQIDTLSRKNRELEQQLEASYSNVNLDRVEDDDDDHHHSKMGIRCNHLTKENESLKQALKQLKERNQGINNLPTEQHNTGDRPYKAHRQTPDEPAEVEATRQQQMRPLVDSDRSINEEENAARVSPSTSVRDDNQTNSSSSFDSSSYGYVHIKPTAFEIISRTSVLEDAQNQIDNLTKAYLDSENTNSLLTEQVCALKEEIRRIQRGNERMELANNLEYLKNVIFKFISLDNSQLEQKQRLIPVLSTILKLSPDETHKLNNLTLTEKAGMTSSFFKL